MCNKEKWIPIEESLPTNATLTRYHVKMQVGSISTKETETVVLGRLYPTGFRFMTGDWQRVTHWRKWTPENHK
jgi:hypothetical protein